jgi:ATP-dependent Clp protease ATP-binding subunit ClpC
MPTSPERPAGSREPGSALPSFNELINDLLGLPPDGKPVQVRGMPLSDLLNAHAHELVFTAAKRVHDDGSPNLTAEHLLWAAAKVDPSRSLFLKVSVDPDVVASEIDKILPRRGEDPSGRQPRGLGPDAARIIGTAHARALATGSSQIGPEHILDALLNEPQAGVAAMLSDESVDVRRLRMFTEGDERRLRNNAEDTAGGSGR